MRVMSPLELSAIPYPCVSCPFTLALLVVLAYFLSPSVATIVTKIFSYHAVPWIGSTEEHNQS